MTDSNLPSFYSSGNHLSPEQIYQYLDNELPAIARHEIEAHLQDCAICNEALEGISHAPTQNTKQVIFELSHHLKKRAQPRKRNSPLNDLKNWGLAAIILMLIIIAAIVVWYQVKHNTGTSNPGSLFIKEQPVSPVTGLGAFQNYIQDNIQYPAEALRQKIQGDVVVSFVINPDSTISEIQVIKSLGYGLDEEAIRLVKSGPKWHPAIINGQIVSQTHHLSVPFRLPADK